MKKVEGVTLLTLAIAVIVLGILASVTVYSGIEIVRSSKVTAFSTELKIMQTYINSMYEEAKKTDGVEEANKKMGKEITGVYEAKARNIFKQGESGITSYDGYRYWSKEYIKNDLKIEGVERDFFVNLNNRSIVSYEGVKDDQETYYTLEQLPDGLYNVKYNN